MPAPRNDIPVARGNPLPAAVRTYIKWLKVEVEALIDGNRPMAHAQVLGEAAARQAFHSAMVGFEIQNEDLRAAVLHLADADAAYNRVTTDALGELDRLDDFARLIGEAYDRVCAVLWAELPIHVPAPAEAA